MLKSKLIAGLGCVLGIAHAQTASAQNAMLQHSAGKVSFYFAAHEDDWQLFMNPSAFEDVISRARKTVFVHLTAGDAGLGVGNGGRKHPFYLARENGAESAIRFMVDGNQIPSERTASQVQLNNHPLHRIGYRNTVAYFFRLPDGNLDGGGFAGTGYQSLKRLAGGDIDTLTAVDGSTAYHGWSDLVVTIKALLDFERADAPSVQLNVADVDVRRNPRDHSDHLYTAKVALDAAKGLLCARRSYYIDYASSRLPENLRTQERDMQSAVFAVTLAGVLALDHGTSWRHYHRSYVGRNYFRTEEGVGRCTRETTEVSASQH
jgi:hypothetical protein